MILTILGCASPQDVTWLEGFSYEWVRFNHRLSMLHLDLQDENLDLAVIGGTSTTSYVPDLPPGCDEATCDELPVPDEAEVVVQYATTSMRKAAAANTTVDLVVGPDGASGEATVTLPRKAIEDGTIGVIQGIQLDTNAPLTGGDACYLPQNGWLPNRLGIVLGEPSIDGDVVTVSVQAHFTAGPTLEKTRTCIDEVADEAQIALTVSVGVITTRKSIETTTVQQNASYLWGSTGDPDEQVLPSPTSVEVGDDQLAGWQSMDWSFHEAGDRGAYLRTLSLEVTDDGARGGATNYSPGTQLSGFDYTFEGELATIEVGTEVTRHRFEETIEAEVDDLGVPIIHTFELD